MQTSSPLGRTEFDLIQTHFKNQQPARSDTLLGIGDDGAVVSGVGADQSIVVVADTLVKNIHFFADTDPFRLAGKALSVNLSDLAAMGASPAWFTLCLTLESANHDWLSQFSKGLFHVANEYGVQLVGGDTSRGPLSISIQALGRVAKHAYVSRAGARVGDDIWVTGQLGEAAIGLAILQGEDWLCALGLNQNQEAYFISRLEAPTPRCNWVQALAHLATSAIDISDGLGQDLCHLCFASKVGANLDLASIPLPSRIEWSGCEPVLRTKALTLSLRGGDDYEICFTAAKDHREKIAVLSKDAGLIAHRIGSITRECAIIWHHAERFPGVDLSNLNRGYGHFNH